jgi:hypothetical protein
MNRVEWEGVMLDVAGGDPTTFARLCRQRHPGMVAIHGLARQAELLEIAARQQEELRAWHELTGRVAKRDPSESFQAALIREQGGSCST